jgi:SAM-dependent methyltransferase
MTQGFFVPSSGKLAEISGNTFRPVPFILDLGCGNAKEPGAVGLDNVQLPGVDIVHDLREFPYPFKDATADEIYLKHVVEHFALADLQRIFGEAYRILKPGGVMHVRVPHVFSVAAWVDPTHRMGFTFLTGIFFTAGADKAYYKETQNLWELVDTSARVTWFNWKRYRLRQLDSGLSWLYAKVLNFLLRRPNMPGSADLLVKLVPAFFVEIRWRFKKATA